MPLVWSLIIVFAMPGFTLKLLFILGFYYLLRNRKIWVYFLVFLIASQPMVNGSSPKGRVSEINDYSFTLTSGLQNYKIKGTYQGTLDDRVEITETLLERTPGDYRFVATVDSYDSIELLSKGRSFRTFLHGKVLDNEFIHSVLFNKYIEDFPLISSLSLQVGGLLFLIQYTLRFKYEKRGIRKIQVGFLIIYGLIFGFNFGVFRYLISRMGVKREDQMSLCLALFPGVHNSLAFILPFSYELLRGLSPKLEKIPRSFAHPLILSFYTFRFSILESLFFRLQQIFCALVFLLSLISLILPIEGQILSLVSIYTKTMNQSRFTLHGQVSFLSIILIVFCFYKSWEGLAYSTLVISLFLLLFPLTWRVTFIDIGQGDATLIQSPLNAYTILIDTGHPSESYKFNRALKRYGVNRINSLILTHDDLDHMGNIGSVDEITDEFSYDKEDPLPFLKSYLKEKSYDDANQDSLVLSFSMKRTSFLFMGDAGRLQERDFIKENPFSKYDVVKIGHHGSKTSTSSDFIASVQPKYGIISAKKKVYGHPHIEVLETLYKYRVKDLNTEHHGDIRFVSGFLFDYLVTSKAGFGIIR